MGMMIAAESLEDRHAREAGPFHVTNRLIFSIALPMTLGFLTTPLLGIVDTAVVGRLGRAELLAGLAIGAVMFDLIFTTFNFLRAATTGLVAQAYGGNSRRCSGARLQSRSFAVSLSSSCRHSCLRAGSG
jgi:Na+-driven multidrug efflux pump